jgi:exosortase
MPMTSRRTIAAGLTLIAFALCYAGVAVALVDKWSTNYIYSYGFAVPLISAYMAWARWPRIQALTPAPDYGWGVALTIAGVSALVIGRVGALLAVQELSLIVTLSGVVLLLLGRRAFGVLAFPIFYLVLCIPVWDYPISLFQEPSQTLSARIALRMLHSIGIPVFRDGTHLVLPSVTLEVLRECSGVNQLVAIVAMTLPAGFLWLRSYWRRAALILIAVVTAYLSNGFRIALIGVLAHNNMRGASSKDPIHLLQGLVVSSVGYLLIGACLSILARTETRTAASEQPADDAVAPQGNQPRAGWLEAAVVCVLLLGAGYTSAFRPLDVQLLQDLRALPTVIGDWTAEPSAASSLAIPGVDDHVSRVYRNGAGGRVELYVGYHRYQIEGKEFGADANRAANQAANDRTAFKTVVWYDVNGRVLSNVYLARAYSIWDAITTRRTNAAIVIVRWNRTGDSHGTPQSAAEMQFVDALMPLLRQYFPASDGYAHTAHVRVAP